MGIAVFPADDLPHAVFAAKTAPAGASEIFVSMTDACG
jgi:hypothetical protein